MQYRWLDKSNQPDVQVQRPRPGRWVRPARLKVREIHVLHRRGLHRDVEGPTELEARAVPRTEVLGSVQERIVYKELQKRKIPFDFQSSLQGGRLQLGGMVADFILQDRPLIIRVQGSTWHTSFAAMKRDESQKLVIEGYGYVVVDIWDWEIEDDALREAWFSRNIDLGMVRAV